MNNHNTASKYEPEPSVPVSMELNAAEVISLVGQGLRIDQIAVRNLSRQGISCNDFAMRRSTNHVKRLLAEAEDKLCETGESASFEAAPRIARKAKKIKLSKRQAEAVILAAQGLSNGEAAETMGCGIQNVANLLRAAWDKFGAQGRSDGLVAAVRYGVIKLGIAALSISLATGTGGNDSVRTRLSRTASHMRITRREWAV